MSGRLFLVCGVLLRFTGPLQADENKIPGYSEVAVFPLPDRPPNNLEELFGVLCETVSTGSRLEETQSVLWLQQLPPNDLVRLRAGIPSPWSASSMKGYTLVDGIRLKEQIDMALMTHPGNPEFNDEILTAPLRAFRLAGEDWSAALGQLPEAGTSDLRARYEDGLNHAIQRADSLPEAIAKYKEVYGQRYHLVHSPLLKAWPIHEIQAYLGTLDVETTSGWLPHLEPRGIWFFSEQESLREFSRRLSRYPRVVSPRVGETMAPVMVARSPERFFAWLSAQSKHHQKWAATGAKKYLVRTGGAPLAELYRRFPDLKDEPKKGIPWFNPATMDLLEHAEALIRQNDPKAVRFGAVSFGKRWGKVDGPAAFAWTMKNVPEEHRAFWLQMVLNGWAHKDAEAAGKAFDGLDNVISRELRDDIILKNRDHYHTVRTPAVYTLPADLRGPAFPTRDGGMTDRWNLTELVKELESGVIPPGGTSSRGFPFPVLNARVSAQILALKKGTLRSLVGHLQGNPPGNARGVEVRRLVMERWALDEPRAASTWLVYSAPGSLRPVLPLSLGRLALEDPEAAIALSNKIPEEHLARLAVNAIARNLAASRGFPKAIALCDNEAGQMLSTIWLRHDNEAAEAWRESQWIFD